VNLCFLLPVGLVGHIVHFDVYMVQIIGTLFFMLDGLDAVYIESTSGHVMLNLCFCIRRDLRGT
jgi:hypothetical protein